MKICKPNIDESPETPTKFSVRGIPTLLLFKNGAVVSQKVGAAAKSQLSAWIDSNIKILSSILTASKYVFIELKALPVTKLVELADLLT